MTLNASNPQPIKIGEKDLPMTEQFKYLGSSVRYDCGVDKDIQSRLNKARNSFKMLNNVSWSSQYGTRAKLKIYHSCVLSTFLYWSECWRMTESDLRKLSTFHTKSLRKILCLFWPQTISNKDLLKQCEQENIHTIIMQRRWRWIGHVIRRERDSVSKTAFHWTTEGMCKQGRPKNTW